ncbi:MAG: FtsX-like permease family protein, partial [Acidobacteriota bacterium]
SHVVSTRTREIGVRLALGAQRRDILRLVVGQAARVAVAASLAGLAAAALAGSSLRVLLFEVAPGDPRTLGAAVAVLVCTALAASYLPVRRMLAQNPLRSLRNE